jgi:hypothetical protein
MLHYREAFNIIKEWLDKCNSIRKLDSNFDSRIKYALLNNSIKTGYKPISFEKLKKYNLQLYSKLEGQ